MHGECGDGGYHFIIQNVPVFINHTLHHNFIFIYIVFIHTAIDYQFIKHDSRRCISTFKWSYGDFTPSFSIKTEFVQVIEACSLLHSCCVYLATTLNIHLVILQ